MVTFNPSTYECDYCKDKLRSEKPGHFVECKCGRSFVDETEYYVRLGGSLTKVEEGDNGN